MWNQWNTDDYDGMIAELIRIKGNGDETINAYVSRPLGPGPHPGIVLVHHLPGWDELYREFARRFTQHGYVVICPQLLSAIRTRHTGRSGGQGTCGGRSSG